jgi:PAS domain S-box-containing protein
LIEDVEDIFRAVFDSSPIPINIFDVDGNFVTGNKAILELAGVESIEDLKDFNIFNDPNIPDDVKDQIRRGEKIQRNAEIDFSKVKQNGLYTTTQTGIVYLEAAHNPLYNKTGEISGYIVQMVNITRERESRFALEDSEARYRNLLEQSNDGIVLADSSGIIFEWNRRMEEISGISKDMAVGRPVWEMTIELSNPEARTAEAIKQAKVFTLNMLENGEAPTGIQNDSQEIHRSDGTIRQIQGGPFVVQIDKGVFLASIVRDVTEFQQLRDNLENQKGELSEFAHNIAHDLRAMIQIIHGYAELLQEKYNPAWALEISHSAKRMSGILEQSLLLADAGRIVGEPQQVELGTLIEDVVKNTAPDDIILRHDRLPVILCDEQKTYQIFQNLITNAIEHGEAKTIEVTAERDGTGLLILVANDGRSIPKDHRQKIFDQGFSTKQGGGLGLSITKKIVEAHGWRIDLVESGITTFSIYIPKRSIVDKT